MCEDNIGYPSAVIDSRYRGRLKAFCFMFYLLRSWELLRIHQLGVAAPKDALIIELRKTF